MPILRAAASNVVNRNMGVKKMVGDRKVRTFARRRMSNNNISSRSSSISSAIESKFKATFKIKKTSDGSAVFYKQDGERFNSQQSLKLQSSVDYTVTMEITPPMELLFIKFAGIDYTFEILNDPDNDTKSVYQFIWSTHGIEPTLNRHRSDVPCVMKFKNYKELEFKVQGKFYPDGDSAHVTWGHQLNYISIDCTAGRGTFISTVNNVSFF